MIEPGTEASQSLNSCHIHISAITTYALIDSGATIHLHHLHLRED